MSSKKRSSDGPRVVVEVGNDWLKIIQAERARSGIQVTRAFVHRLEGSVEPVADVIANAIETGDFADVPVRLCLPRHLANVRMLDLPSTDPREIADMVDLQIGKLTPYSRDEIMIAYRFVGAAREGYTRVMLVIVQRAAVRQRFVVVEDAGLDVVGTWISSEGLLSWYAASGVNPDAGTILLDVDAGYTDFAVVSGGGLGFTRSIMIGAHHLIEDAPRWTEKYIQEMRHSLEVYRSEGGGQTVGRILLTGAGPHVAGLDQQLREALDLPVEAIDPLQPVTLAAGVTVLQEPASREVSVAPLIGALVSPDAQELDFTPDAVKFRRALERKARQMTVFGVEVMAALMLAAIFAEGCFHSKRTYRDALQASASQAEREADKIEQMRLKTRVIADRLDPVRSPLNMLREIQGALPDSVYLTGITMEEGKQIVIRGWSPTGSDVAQLVSALEKSPLFKGVKRGSSTRQDFEIVCQPEK